MKISTLSRSLALIAVTVLATTEMSARGHSGNFQGARGGTYQRQVNRDAGNVTASRNATLPDGRTASANRTSEMTDTGRTTTAERTGFDGKTSTYNSTTTKTDNGYVREAQATGQNGGTATKEVTVTKENGTVNRTVTTSATPKP